MRRKITFAFIACFILIFIFVNNYSKQSLPNEILEYYKDNHLKDTGAKNIVTAIYLNYRVFDTLFEALMLLISVIGIKYFSRHEGGEHNE